MLSNNIKDNYIAELKGIVANECWDDLASWAARYDGFVGEIAENLIDDEEYAQKADELYRQVKGYTHPSDLPDLPVAVVYQLHDIAIIFQKNARKRILLAIDLLRHYNQSIVAMGEQDGNLDIYTRQPIDDIRNTIYVGNETWTVTQHVPYRKEGWHKWDEFQKECGLVALGFPPPKWKQEPATPKQLSFLRSLGAKELPKTKLDASVMIDSLLRQRDGC